MMTRTPKDPLSTAARRWGKAGAHEEGHDRTVFARRKDAAPSEVAEVSTARSESRFEDLVGPAYFEVHPNQQPLPGFDAPAAPAAPAADPPLFLSRVRKDEVPESP